MWEYMKVPERPANHPYLKRISGNNIQDWNAIRKTWQPVPETNVDLSEFDVHYERITEEEANKIIKESENIPIKWKYMKATDGPSNKPYLVRKTWGSIQDWNIKRRTWQTNLDRNDAFLGFDVHYEDISEKEANALIENYISLHPYDNVL